MEARTQATHARTRRGLALLLALAAALLVLAPALRIGFLADDYFLVGRLAEHAHARPHLLERLGAGAVHSWSTRFHAFRPLTVVSLQLDHALHGIDARGYRCTNVLLWLLAAGLFSAVCAAYLGLVSASARAGTLLVFALWPVAVEPIGWTVIRQDALLVAGALGAALVLRRQRQRPWLVGLPLAVALAAKETAVVLPPMLVALDRALLLRERCAARREGCSSRRVAAVLLRRSWPWFAVLAAWLGARAAAGVSDTWSGQSYSAFLFSSATPARVLERLPGALRALLAPVNLVRGTGLERALLVSGLALPALAAAGFALARCRRADFAAGALWFLTPLCLLLPFYAVAESLQSVRILVLPGVVWLFLVVAGAARLAGTRPQLSASAACLFLACEAAALRFDLAAYAGASARAEQLLADARAWPPGRALLLRAREGPSLAPTLRMHEGAYVLSGAIRDALAPPFRSARVEPVLLPAEDEANLAELVGVGEADRPTLAVLVASPEGPRLRLLGEGGAAGVEVTLVPRHGASLPRGAPPTLAVGASGDAVRAGDECTVTVCDLAGNRASARRVVRTADIHEGRVRLAFESSDFGLEPSIRALLTGSAGCLIWSARLTRGAALVARPAYAVVAFDG